MNYKVIPPKTTGELQPLDVFFNRQLKAFYRILSDKIRRRYPTFDVSNRKGIGTLLNLTFSQMASPLFSDMIKFAWYKSGYLSERPPPFLTPVQYCFDLIETTSKCIEEGCDERAFIKCANCSNFFCFQHFVVKMHGCVDLINNDN